MGVVEKSHNESFTCGLDSALGDPSTNRMYVNRVAKDRLWDFVHKLGAKSSVTKVG